MEAWFRKYRARRGFLTIEADYASATAMLGAVRMLLSDIRLEKSAGRQHETADLQVAQQRIEDAIARFREDRGER